MCLLSLASCASRPRAEVQGEYFHHRSPDYSLRIPDGWRQATVADVGSFGWSGKVRARLDEESRLRWLRMQANAFGQYDFVMISTRGATLVVRSFSSGGARLPAGYRLSERERQAQWELTRPQVLKRLASDWGIDIERVPEELRPRLALEAMEVVEYGPNTALRVRIRGFDPVGGTGVYSYVVFYGPSHIVGITHSGIPEDLEEGLAGFEEAIRSFRFQ